MSTARAKAQPSAVAAAASQVASTANNAATGSAADSAPTKTIHLSKVMEAAATAAKAASANATSANATTQEGSQQMTDAAVEAMTELAKSMQAVADAVTTDVKETQSPQPVAEQQSTTLKETAMSDKTNDKPKAEDKKTDEGFMSKTKDVLTGPTAKAVGLVLLATAAGAAGGYGAVEMQRRRQMAAKGRMA